MANKIYVNPETGIKWLDTGGDELMDLTGLADGAGRNGALHDWGTAPRARRYHFKMTLEFQATPALGAQVELYIREAGIDASATDPTNDDGGDVAVSAIDKLGNLKLVGVMAVDEAAVGIVTSIEGEFETAARHFGPTVWNESGAATDTTTADNYVEIWPAPDEIQ